jgi:hypothetical protein
MKKNFFNVVLLKLCLVTFSCSLSSDLVAQVVTPSNEVFYKVEETPVTMSKGLPNIGFPLFSLQAGDYTLPVSLSYHAGGMKVQDIGSEVGNGWSINAGGRIGATHKSIAHMTPKGWNEDDFYYTNFVQGSDEYSLPHMVQPQRLSLPNESCQIYLAAGGNHFTVPYTDLIIEGVDIDENDFADPYSFINNLVTVTDANGIKYVFNDWITTSTENSTKTCEAYLSEIITLDNDTIAFSYETETFKYYLNNGKKFERINSYKIGTNTYQPLIRELDVDISYPLVTNVVLSEIRVASTGDKIKFVKGAARKDLSNFLDQDSQIPKTLKFVERRDKFDNLIARYEFNCKYLSNGIIKNPEAVSETDNNRILLGGLTKQDALGQDQMHWSFDYFIGQFPARNTFGRDFNGYYNGKNYNKSLITLGDLTENGYYSQSINEYTHNANRVPSFEHAKIGLLNQITYPTGGKTKYEYEFSDAPLTKNIRIKRIQIAESDDNYYNKDYTYEGNSEDRLMSTELKSYTKIYEGSSGGVGYVKYTQTIGSASIIEREGYYTKVIETLRSKNEESKGYTEYIYTNVDDEYMSNPNKHVKKEDNEWECGWLRYVNIYNEEGNCLKSTENIYQIADVTQSKNYNHVTIWNYMSQSTSYEPAGGGGGEYYNHFHMEDYNSVDQLIEPTRHYLSKTFEKTYFGNDSVVVETSSHYDSYHQMLRSQTVKTSEDDNITTQYFYPLDYNNSVTSIAALRNANILNVPIKTEKVVNNKLIEGQVTRYNDKGRPLSTFIYENDQTVNVPSHNANLLIPPNYHKRGSFLYNDFGNIIQEESPDELINSYAWGYDNQFVVAKGLGINSADLSFAVEWTLDMYFNQMTIDEFMNDIGDLSTTTQKQKWFVFNKLLRMHDNTTNAKIYTYTYNANIGMTSQTDFNGIMTHYKYDDSGRLTTELDHDMNIINKYEYNYINNTNE